MICKKCYHFAPEDGDGWFYYRCASCEHPDCFEKVRRQNDSGEIYLAKERVKDIIDFVDDQDNCVNFQS